MKGLSFIVAISLALVVANALEQELRKQPGPETTEPSSSAESWKPMTLTVDWLFSQSAASKVASKTTICTQKCVVITLPTSKPSTTTLATSAVAGPPVSVSCITIGDSTIESTQTLQPSSTKSKGATSTATTSSWTRARPVTTITRLTTVGVTVTTPTGTTESKKRLTSTLIQSPSTPCTTDITITKTLTKTKTWRSTLPITSTLVHTHLTTMTNTYVEPYSTSTGEYTQTGLEKTTETISTVSVEWQCSDSDTSCHQVSPTPCISEGGSKAAASGTAIFEDSKVSQGNTQPPVYLSTPVVSASWVTSVTPMSSWSRGVVTDQSSASSSAVNEEEGDARTFKDGATSVSTAGAAAITVGVGMGALVGVIIAMA